MYVIAFSVRRNNIVREFRLSYLPALVLSRATSL